MTFFPFWNFLTAYSAIADFRESSFVENFA